MSLLAYFRRVGKGNGNYVRLRETDWQTVLAEQFSLTRDLQLTTKTRVRLRNINVCADES